MDASRSARWAHARLWLLELPRNRTVLFLGLLLGAGLSIIAWQIFQAQQTFFNTLALQEATSQTAALREFRTLYTSEVVERVRPHNITVTHDYDQQVAAIPLPATLAILLGERIGATQSSAEVLAHAFEPYFTTRSLGNGLGLATSYAIVERHGGVIELDSTAHVGTSVTILLPASREQP